MTPLTSRQGPRTPGRHPRARLAAAMTAGLLVLVAGPAYGYWTASSTGPYARAQAATLATPGLTVGSVTATSAALAWTQPFAPTAYALSQAPGTVTGCPPAPGIASSGCTATSLSPNTTYTWTLAASLHTWVSPSTVTATTSKQATTTTLSALTPTTATAGTGFSATATVTGNAGYGTPAGTATLSLYAGSTCAGAPAYTSAAQTLTGGATTTTLHPALGTYSWRATYTPTDTVNLTSTSACSAPVTVTAAGATYAGAGAPVTVTSSSSNVVVPYPAGTATGDLMLLVVVNNATQTSTVSSSGWNVVDNAGLGGSGMQITAWWHAAGAETSVTLASLKTNSDGATAWVLDYKNAGTPALAGVSSGTASSASALTPTGLTTTAPDTTVISLVGINTAAALSLQTPQGFAARASLQNATGVGRTLGVADRFAATAGSLTPPTWTEGATASQWAYITVAFSS